MHFLSHEEEAPNQTFDGWLVAKGLTGLMLRIRLNKRPSLHWKECDHTTPHRMLRWRGRFSVVNRSAL